MNFSWAMDLDPKGASNQIKELIDRHYGSEDEMMIHSNNNQTNGANPIATNDVNFMISSGANQTPNNTPFQQRSTLTPTGVSAAGTSSAVVINVPGTSSAGSSNTSNGSNNSNNISNGPGSSSQVIRSPTTVNTVRRIAQTRLVEDSDEA